MSRVVYMSHVVGKVSYTCLRKSQFTPAIMHVKSPSLRRLWLWFKIEPLDPSIVYLIEEEALPTNK